MVIVIEAARSVVYVGKLRKGNFLSADYYEMEPCMHCNGLCTPGASPVKVTFAHISFNFKSLIGVPHNPT